MKVFEGLPELIWWSMTTWTPMKATGVALAILFVTLLLLVIRAFSKSGRKA